MNVTNDRRVLPSNQNGWLPVSFSTLPFETFFLWLLSRMTSRPTFMLLSETGIRGWVFQPSSGFCHAQALMSTTWFQSDVVLKRLTRACPPPPEQRLLGRAGERAGRKCTSLVAAWKMQRGGRATARTRHDRHDLNPAGFRRNEQKQQEGNKTQSREGFPHGWWHANRKKKKTTCGPAGEPLTLCQQEQHMWNSWECRVRASYIRLDKPLHTRLQAEHFFSVSIVFRCWCFFSFVYYMFSNKVPKDWLVFIHIQFNLGFRP